MKTTITFFILGLILLACGNPQGTETPQTENTNKPNTQNDAFKDYLKQFETNQWGKISDEYIKKYISEEEFGYQSKYDEIVFKNDKIIAVTIEYENVGGNYKRYLIYDLATAKQMSHLEVFASGRTDMDNSASQFSIEKVNANEVAFYILENKSIESYNWINGYDRTPYELTSTQQEYRYTISAKGTLSDRETLKDETTTETVTN